jgi:hypothetical protein
MSDTRWSLSVEDFGPIKAAATTLAPLTLFVGQNSSGKSYLASLFWALLNAGNILLQPELISGPAYDAAKEVVRAILTGEKKVVAGEDWTKILALINQVLSDPSGKALAGIFAVRGLKAGSICAKLTALPDDLQVIVTTDQPVDASRSRRPRRQSRFVDGALHLTLPDPIDNNAPDLDLWMLRILTWRLNPQTNSAEYIPAARTGLMLTLKVLVGSLLGQGDRESESGAQLNFTAPVREFLQSVHFASPYPGNPHFAIAEYLENSVLKGRIDQTENEDFRFVLDGSNVTLPLHATSSLVTELMPFIVMLKQKIDGTLIFEEPEAHLHLAAQRSLARALVRLVNTGVPVLVTTHSDTFLQQINILMQLHGHPDRDALAAEFGYDPSEFLNPADSQGYIFDPTDGRTIVREMMKTTEGFIEPLMNATIAELTREVLAMESR